MEKESAAAFVFVLMPFSDAFTDVYEVGIKPACKDAGAYCERVDEQIFVENILQRVYDQIVKADIIVAEMTGRNPNVFYEVGYAHALNKRVILLTQNADDIPFDLKHYPHIVYNARISVLKQQLETRIRWMLEHYATETKQVWDAAALMHKVGKRYGQLEWGASVPSSQDFLIYGQYINLRPGVYTVEFRLKIDEISGSNTDVAMLDVVSRGSTKTFARNFVSRAEFLTPNTYQSFLISFKLEQPETEVEFRVWYANTAELVVERIELTPG